MTRDPLRWRENYNFICKFWLRARQWQNKLFSLKVAMNQSSSPMGAQEIITFWDKSCDIFHLFKVTSCRWHLSRPLNSMAASSIRDTSDKTSNSNFVKCTRYQPLNNINNNISFFTFRAPIHLRNVLQNNYHFPVSHFETKFHPSLFVSIDIPTHLQSNYSGLGSIRSTKCLLGRKT